MITRIARTTGIVFLALLLFVIVGFISLDRAYVRVESRELAHALAPVGIRAARDPAHLGMRLVDVARLGEPFAVDSAGTRTYHDGVAYIVTHPTRDGRHVLLARTTLDWVPGWTMGAVWLSIALGVALVTGILVGAPLVLRIRALEAATRAIADGALGARAVVHGTDEIAELARHFNTMASRVEWHARAQETMLQAIAHEYRTPLTTARFALALCEEATEATDRALQTKRLRSALDELETLADEVETYARRGGDTASTFAETHMSDVIDAAIAGLSARVPIETQMEACEGAVVHGDPRLLRRLVRNLVENACRHARSRARVRLRQDASSVYVEVEDDGPGVPAEDRTRVFEPFVRLSTSHAEPGRGLGLAIVARVAELHGGRAEVREGEVSGARFVVTLPRFAASS